MIALKKSGKPESLCKNADRWTNQLLGHRAAGEDIPPTLKRAYSQDDVKDALRTEASSKCIYCESKIGHVAHEHIDHLKPKSKFPELTFDWYNLGLSCPICNTNKGDEYDDAAPFVNPFKDDPSEHLVAVGCVVCHVPGSASGEVTEQVLKLNRPELIERRLERINALRRLLDRIATESNEALRQVLNGEIEEELKDDKPYAFCARSTVAALKIGDKHSQAP